MSLYNTRSDDAEAGAPELLPIFSELKPEALHYTNRTLIAKGGMKTIYKVYDPKTARYVAMATLNEDSPEELYEPFLREARLTALLDHPNIITIHDIGLAANSRPYFTMELKTGRSLDIIIQERFAPLGPGSADSPVGLLNIFLKICDAIDYAHSQKVVHLDLKPENIQVGAHGEVVVCDWGLGKLIGNADYDGGEFDRLLLNPDLLNHMTLTGRIKGTPGFMAPVQARGEGDKTFQTDIYALGAILYNLLTNRLPVEGDTPEELMENTIHGRIVPPHERFPKLHISPALSAVAMKALSLNPGKRYAAVRDLRDDLDSYLHGFSTSAENAGMVRELRLFYRRNKRMVNVSALSLLLLLIATVFSFISIRRSERDAVAALQQLKQEQAERERLGREAAPRFYRRAVDELARGNPAGALRQAHAAYVLDNAYEDARNLLGALLFLQDRYAEADKIFQGRPQSLYRLISSLTRQYLDGMTEAEELLQIEALMKSFSQVTPTPLTTAFFLRWVYDEREAFHEMAFRYFTLRKNICPQILLAAAQHEGHPATDRLVTRVLEVLTTSPEWIGRRIPATLGMELSRSPVEREQFRALIPDNLALGQPVSSRQGHRGKPAYIVDGDIESDHFWSMEPYPSQVTIDLQGLHMVSCIRIFTNDFNRNDAHFGSIIALSTDGQAYPVKVRIGHKTTEQGTTVYNYTIPPEAARFVRLKINFHKGPVPIRIREIEVY